MILKDYLIRKEIQENRPTKRKTNFQHSSSLNKQDIIPESQPFQLFDSKEQVLHSQKNRLILPDKTVNKLGKEKMDHFELLNKNIDRLKLSKLNLISPTKAAQGNKDKNLFRESNTTTKSKIISLININNILKSQRLKEKPQIYKSYQKVRKSNQFKK